MDVKDYMTGQVQAIAPVGMDAEGGSSYPLPSSHNMDSHNTMHTDLASLHQSGCQDNPISRITLIYTLCTPTVHVSL